MTDEQKKLVRIEAERKRTWQPQIADAIEALLKEVEACEKLVGYLEKQQDKEADFALRLFYSYVMPPEGFPMNLPEGWKWVIDREAGDYLERTDGAEAFQDYDGRWYAVGPDGTFLNGPKIRGPISAARVINKKYPLE